MTGLILRGITRAFDHPAPRQVLDGIDLWIAKGEFVSLVGPSGAGKTTLLRIIAGLDGGHSGELTWQGPRPRMGIVFQEPRLVPWRTCLENVLLPLELTRNLRAAGKARALELLDQLGLSERLGHFPGELSGGMQMRVALARALVTQPKIVLLDEPFAALDERTRYRMQDLLLELKSRLHLQYVFVTHSIAEAVYLGDMILLLDNTGQARDRRDIEFAERTQFLKLSPAFNAIVQDYAQLFASMEPAAGPRQDARR